MLCSFCRNIKVYKSYVKNKKRPEGCIAESYTVQELINISGGYLKGMKAIGSTHGRNEVCDEEVEEVILHGNPLSTPIPSELDDISWEQARSWVLFHTNEVDPWIE